MAQNPQWLVNKYPKNLKGQIRELIGKGYVVVSQDATSAQLVRKKTFSFLIAFLSLFVFGFGFLLYLIWYLAKRDDLIYLDLETQVYDPDWEKKKNKTAKQIGLVLLAIFAAMVVLGMVVDIFDGPNEPEAMIENPAVTG